MKILLFGATGMVGQGVLREALLDPEIDEVLCVGRASIGESVATAITRTKAQPSSTAIRRSFSSDSFKGDSGRRARRAGKMRTSAGEIAREQDGSRSYGDAKTTRQWQQREF